MQFTFFGMYARNGARSQCETIALRCFLLVVLDLDDVNVPNTSIVFKIVKLKRIGKLFVSNTDIDTTKSETLIKNMSQT